MGSSEWNRDGFRYPREIIVTRRSDAADNSYAESDMNRDPDTESTYGDPQRVKDGDGSSSKPADVGYVHRRKKKVGEGGPGWVLVKEFVYKKSNGPITYPGMDGNTTSTPGDVGWWGMTWWAGVQLVSPQNVAGGYLDVAIAQDYNIKLMDLRRTYVAKNPGEKDRFTVSLLNQMPFDVRDVHLRAYLQEKGKGPVPLFFNKTVPKLRGYGRGWDAEGPQAVYASKEFEAPVPKEPYKIIATANIYYDGKWYNQDLVSDWRNSGGRKIFGASGAAETDYADNVQEMALAGFGKPGPEPSPQPEPEPNEVDLSADSLTLYDGQAVDMLKEQTAYKTVARFTNKSDRGGFATVRLYSKLTSMPGADYILRDDELAYFEPHGAFEWESKYTSGRAGDTVEVAATVDYWWDEEWYGEKFWLEDGTREPEARYDNNKVGRDYGINRGPPQKESHYASYDALIPVEEKVYVDVDEKYYIPLPIEKAPKVKKRVRLVE